MSKKKKQEKNKLFAASLEWITVFIIMLLLTIPRANVKTGKVGLQTRAKRKGQHDDFREGV